MAKNWICTQWYKDSPWTDEQREFYWLQEMMIRKLAPGIPVLCVNNGSPMPPPERSGWEVVNAVEMLPHARATHAHYANCWRSMSYAFEILSDRDQDMAVFLGQNLIPGVPFIEPCERIIDHYDVLFTMGCLGPDNAFTEYMAVNLKTARPLYSARLLQGQMLEPAFPQWVRGRLRAGVFPGFWKMRDWPRQREDTYLFHNPMSEVREFCAERGVVYNNELG